LSGAALIRLEVVYATPVEQVALNVEVSAGATVRQAIERSGILQQCPGIDLTQNKVGCWNRVVALDDVVSAGDRIEIYRPLLIDPKEVRRLRAAKDRKGR
jgi:putative ubiquitin-RnfH superfamily antitoxin RatB of RatAB toxin-antitoxin module